MFFVDFTVMEVLPQWGMRDPFSTLSHVLGAVLGVAALAALVWRGRQRRLSRRGQWALAIYGVSMVMGLTASALFHAPMLAPEGLVLFKKLDHAAIFVMIAGTGTVLYNALHPDRAASLIGALWAMCLGALVVKMVVWPMPLWLTALMYVAVGWCALFGLLQAGRVVGWQRLRPLVDGAAVLTLGAVLFAAQWPIVWPGVVEGHEVFHVFVLAGVGIHFKFIYQTCTEPDGGVAPAPAASFAPA